MKKLSFLALAAVGLLFGACSSEKDVVDDATQQGRTGGKGYLALNIQLPTTPSTRAANDIYDDGIASEYAVDNAVLLLFTGGSATDGSDAEFEGSYVLTKKLTDNDLDNDNITTSYKATAEINKTLSGSVWGLVLLNYDGVFTQATNEFGSTSLTVGTSKIKDIQSLTTSATLSTANKFFMTNAVLSTSPGGYNASAAPAKSAVRILSTIDPTKIYDSEAVALENGNEAGSIYVERAVAKVTLSGVPGVLIRGVDDSDTNKPNDDPADLNIASVEWAVGNSEASTFIVRNMFDANADKTDEITDYLGYSSGAFGSSKYYRFVGDTKVGTTTIQPIANLYRTYWCVDPHYSTTLTSPGASLTAATYEGKTGTPAAYAPVYPYENTFNVANQKYNNTARAMFKVTLENTATFYTINGSDEQSTEAAAKAAIINQLVLTDGVKNAFKNNWIGSSTYSYTITSSDLDVTLSTDAGNCTASALTLSATFLASAAATNFNTTDVNSNLAALTDELANANSNVNIQRYNGGVMYYETRIQHFANPADAGYTSGIWNGSSPDLAPWNTWETAASVTAPSPSSAYPGTTAESEKNYLGRYGMVRNNWYDISIDMITHLGSPTDVSTTIGDKDDDNLEPEKKDLSVKINVLSWAKRTQSWSF